MPDDQKTIAAGADAATADDATAAAAGAETVAETGTKVTEAATGGDAAAAGADTAAKTEAASEAAADDWRRQMVGEDDAALKQLERYASPKAVWEKVKNLEKLLNKKQVRPTRPAADAPDEEKAAWRKAEGIPEKADEYVEKLTLPDGIQLGDDDKPIVASYAAAMHEVGVPQEAVDKAMAWYFGHLEEVHTAQAEEDEAFRAQSMTELRNEWQGTDFRRNVNAIGTLFVDAGDGVMDALLAGRTADGRRIGDDPRIVRFLAKMALELNPAATVIPSGQATGTSIEGRIAEIDKIMKTDGGRAYWSDAALQKEYRELLVAREKLQARKTA